MIGPPPTVNVTAVVAVRPNASITCTVNGEPPATLGVPDSTPVPGFRLRPAGRVPAASDQVNGPVPPVTGKVAV